MDIRVESQLGAKIKERVERGTIGDAGEERIDHIIASRRFEEAKSEADIEIERIVGIDDTVLEEFESIVETVERDEEVGVFDPELVIGLIHT